MKRKSKIVIFIVCLMFGLISYQTIKHKTKITKFLVKTILEHKKENAFEFVNKFVSVVPNYANKDGFEIVSKEDYEKYQQGYCLAENRIIDKEELYKMAIGEFLEKELEINKKIAEYRCAYNGGFKDRECNTMKVGYYRLVGINFLNLQDFLDEYSSTLTSINNKNRDSQSSMSKKIAIKHKLIKDFLVEKVGLTKINPMDFLELDLENKKGGFSVPILTIGYQDRKTLKTDHTFDLCGNRISHLYHHINYYDTGKKTSVSCKYKIYKFDNCGNINYDKDKQYADGIDPRGA